VDWKAFQHGSNGGWATSRTGPAVIAPDAFIAGEAEDCGATLDDWPEWADDVLDA
jgi:hypothetical protein